MRYILPIILIIILASCEIEQPGIDELPETAQASGDCEVVSISKSTEHFNYSPDGSKYIVAKQDKVDGVFQIYVGNTGDEELSCISCKKETGTNGGERRSWEERHKVMAQWHPSGEYIICGVEKESYNELLYTPRGLRLGWIQSGLWLDLWAVNPDGSEWFELAELEVGMTGPAFTPDGKKAVFADAQSGSNIIKDVFGVWKLQQVDFTVNSGVPSITNKKDISPEGARWLEPGNFNPDGNLLLFNADIGMDNAEGQDQYIIDINTMEVTNLTNSPEVWDEHGVFSPSGDKVLFMSSYPYRDDPNAYKTLSIKTEFMIMNIDGSNLEQLTHFRTPGFPEYHEGIASTGYWSKDGTKIYAHSLEFPDYHNWIIEHKGNCGN